ncbi:MAG: hypothetical protein E6R04_03105 [Spirochaetes bacterium]|nr:MAG: hypothetical protein E6R04_03105 [Spirochaetota bacterium]
MQESGFKAVFPLEFLYGAGAVLIGWVFGAFINERASNFLVSAGLLVSSRKPHLFTLPIHGTGMSLRTLGALIGIMLIAGGITTTFRYIQRIPSDEPPPRPATSMLSDRSFDDPYMDGGMGMGMGGGYSGSFPPPSYGQPPPSSPPPWGPLMDP